MIRYDADNARDNISLPKIQPISGHSDNYTFNMRHPCLHNDLWIERHSEYFKNFLQGDTNSIFTIQKEIQKV